MSFPQNGTSMGQPTGLTPPVQDMREIPRAVMPPGWRDDVDDQDGQTPPRRFPPPRIPPPRMPPQRMPPPRIPPQKGLPGVPRPVEPTGPGPWRPTQIPQVPFSPPSSLNQARFNNYRPPPGRLEPPQRPPRPSRGPLMPVGFPVEEPVTPVFSSQQRDSASDLLSQQSSRPSTISSVGSIPDFPIVPDAPEGPSDPNDPAYVGLSTQPRRSVTLGPPPSARRGASSFYSAASFVSPIPEESPRSRSHTSYASSRAMPEGWTGSPGVKSPASPEATPTAQPNTAYFDQRITSMYSDSDFGDDFGGDFGDEHGLVRSASVGKRGVPSLVTTPQSRPFPAPLQPDGSDAPGRLGASTSSSGALPRASLLPDSPITSDKMLSAFAAASSSNPSATQGPVQPKGFSRLSAMRRPPRLDMDAVREAEARGSITSLPDLIKRATRLAAMIERGRRPASRFELGDSPQEYGGRGDASIPSDRHQSGFSDMLAAFPPPAQAGPADREPTPDNMRRTSGWPLPFGFRSGRNSQDAAAVLATQPARRSPRTTMLMFDHSQHGEMGTTATAQGRQMNDDAPEPNTTKPRKRRCCGLPTWGFISVVVLVLILIAAAVLIPLNLFVFNDDGDSAAESQPALADCQNELQCANGGTNVISQGVCSCICTNGFTGSNCTIASSDGCATVDLDSTDDETLTDVTLGQAVPRLIELAESDFNVPLSATGILAKLNTGNLSCASQNALVTFEGNSGTAEALLDGGAEEALEIQEFTLTFEPGLSSTVTLTATGDNQFLTIVTAPAAPTMFATTVTFSPSSSLSSTSTPSSTSTSTNTQGTSTASSSTSTSAAATTPTAAPSASFVATDQALDFARVSVLYILQEKTLDEATEAQSSLQRFFSSSPAASNADARNVTVGAGNTVNLINLTVSIGNGLVGLAGES